MAVAAFLPSVALLVLSGASSLSPADSGMLLGRSELPVARHRAAADVATAGLGGSQGAPYPKGGPERQATHQQIAPLLETGPSVHDDNPSVAGRSPRTTDSSLPSRRCLVATTRIRAGSAVGSRDFEPSTCPVGQARRAFRYDRVAQAVRAVRQIEVGEGVAMFAGYEASGVLPGDELHLIATAGPVAVVRKVEALQAAGLGERLFVRSSDGQILSVRYGERRH